MTTLTAQTIAALPAPAAGNKLYFFRGAIVQGRTVPRGLAVRVTAAGARAWVLNYALAGKARRLTIGDVADWSVTDAVKRARELRQEIDRGNDPMTERDQPPAPEVVTVNQVLDKFLERQKIRSLSQYESTFDRLVRPSLGSMPIADLRRRHIMELLDQVEDTRGPVAATRTLAYFRSAMNEWAKRDEDFTVPFVRGMARSSTSERARTRILTDDEIRAAWEVFGTMGNFGLSCRFILLTGARREDVAGMPWTELEGDVWTIPKERYKTARPHTLPLSAAAMEIINAQSKTGRLVFPGSHGSHLSKGSGNVETLRLRLPPSDDPWTLHDLRRTSRSLLSRAGVSSDIGERVLGHALAGVRATYDRHEYFDEKRDALARLAALIERILQPEANVVQLRR
jgi:integrase